SAVRFSPAWARRLARSRRCVHHRWMREGSARGSVGRHPSAQRRAARALLIVGVAVAALAAGVVLAIDDAELQIEAIQGDGWRVEDMSVRFALEREAVQGAVTIGRMQMDMLARELREVRIDCPRLETSVEAFACRDARVARSEEHTSEL